MNPVAQVLKSYGKDGSVLIKIYNDFTIKDFKKDVPVMIYFDSLPVPFFIENIKQKGKNSAIIKLENIDSLEQVDELVKLELFSEKLKKEKLKTNLGTTEFNNLIGITVISAVSSTIVGKISNFYDFSGNQCIEINSTALIPFHPKLVKKFDVKSNSITIQIAEGLL